MERILGEELATPATIAIGVGEVLLGIWIITGRYRPTVAAVQTVALVSMNALEIWRANDLLISAFGMVLLNTLLLIGVWVWALAPAK